MNESEAINKVQHVYDQFKDESDKASVVLVVAVMDEYLRIIIKARLVKITEYEDPLIDGKYAPIGNFSSRIDCAYRLGLISEKLCRDLHTIRQIRNDFSHKAFDCNFGDQSVKDRVSNLKDSAGFIVEKVLESYSTISENPDIVKFKSMSETRQHFLLCSALILALLEVLSTKKIESINKAAEEVFFY
jgi:DNA-binding MltR family transcriptional regulator